MDEKEIADKINKINSLLETDDNHFSLFIDLFNLCKQSNKLFELSKMYIDLKFSPSFFNIDIQFKAINCLLELFDYTKNHYNYYVSLWKAGVLYVQYGHPLKSFTNLLEAEKYFKRISDYNMLFLCWLNLGILYGRINDIEGVQRYFKRCEDLLKEQRIKNKITDKKKYLKNVYLCYYNISFLHTKLKQFDLEKKYIFKTEKAAIETGNVNYILEANLLKIKYYIDNQTFSEADLLINKLNQNEKIKTSSSYYEFLSMKYFYQFKIGDKHNSLKTFRKACEYVKSNHISTSLHFQNILDQVLTLAYEIGTKDDIIFFSKELKRMNNVLFDQSLKVSCKALHDVKNKLDLEQENKYIEEITYILGSDLKLPIITLNTLANSLENSPDQKDKLIPIIKQESEYVLRLMNATLKFNQINTDYNTFEKTSLNKLVKDVVKELAIEISNKKVKVLLENLPEVKGHHNLLKQLFNNIILNSIQYGDSNNEISINAKNSNSYFYLIEIKDKGIGIPENELNSIFDLYKKTNLSRSVTNPGVGLAICKKIVNIHRGSIYAKSDSIKGSSMFIQLPVSA